MASTTISGVNTGLNITNIVETMVTAEKAPKADQLSKLQTKTTAQISGLGSLKSGIASLQTVLKDLNSTALFQKRTATSSDSTLVAASASTTAASGTYKISVGQLATASTVATSAVPKDQTFGTGNSLTLSVGSTALPTVKLPADKAATLGDVRDAINSQLKDSGVSATIVTNPSDGQARLMLTSTKTGEGNDITLDTAGSADLEKLAIPKKGSGNASDVKYIAMASNATFSVNGLDLESATNSVENAIDGVTLTLTAPTTVSTTANGVTSSVDKPITLTVDQDKAGVKGTIKKFVDAYNALVDTTTSLTQVTKVGDDKQPIAAALVGDAGVRQILSTMRSELGRAADGDGSVRILADIGITTDKNGKLAIDDAKLTKALDTNYAAVGNLFTGDTGLMSRLNNKLDTYTQTGGVLESRLNGLNNTIKSIDKQNENLTLRTDQLRTRLLAQFNAMDSLVGQLNSTASSLASSLANLPGVVKS
ncbi:flagellar filament capping protein FliD [Pseudomonas oryzihabitans]|uniref:flagellar filament capping protein FliD n=1 Tax=Pseudomonas oryzihabitans TaxID=47885 RepID=UPI001DCF8D36|nr:flagellar filament capping protein FliD [Pseudomonas oryzihabitans]HJE69377.1 flagellar filament capping protein FliD [Pseudomonas oryzihabitans]